MNRPAIIIDAGANVDSIPAYLCQFAIMGEIHYRHMFGIDQPRVGLLNIGEEDSKGCDLTIKTNMMMKKLPLNYIGNIESRYIFNGSVDLIICDGFTGNTVLKQAEGMGKFFNGIIKKEVKKSLRAKVGGLLLKPAFQAIKACTDASEYGGMPLLGINGPVLIGHGSSDARAVRNAVRSGLQNLKCDINKQIQTAIEKWGNL
ncbi:MAG TPA: hypothetical protein DC049_16005 [Spirochaetia bacterium]|nr:hypothetical protein [Spirochaetia bacterium]